MGRTIELEKAIFILTKNYDRAQHLEYVRNKLAWALYQTWKYYDKENKNADVE